MYIIAWFCVISVGSVLIFVTRKANAEELATNLRARDFKSELKHYCYITLKTFLNLIDSLIHVSIYQLRLWSQSEANNILDCRWWMHIHNWLGNEEIFISEKCRLFTFWYLHNIPGNWLLVIIRILSCF